MHTVKVTLPIFVLFLTFSNSCNAKEYWYIQLKYGDNIDRSDTFDSHDTKVSSRVGYRDKKYSAYLDYSRSDDTGKKRLDLVNSFRIKPSKKNLFKVQNEFNYSYNNKKWSAELTPIYYRKLSKHVKIGFELEIDYYKKDDFDLHEIEIEPTIKYKKKIGVGKLGLELEFPVMRLYSNVSGKKNFEFETAEVLANYKKPIFKNTSLVVEASIPYDLQKNEAKEKYSLSLRYKF